MTMATDRPKFEPMPQWGISTREQYDRAIDFLLSLLNPINEDRDETDTESKLPVW